MLVNAGRSPYCRMDCSRTAGIDWNSSTSISAGTPAGYCASHGRSIVMHSPSTDVWAGIMGDTDQSGLEHRAWTTGKGRMRAARGDCRDVADGKGAGGERIERVWHSAQCWRLRDGHAIGTWLAMVLLLALSTSCARDVPEAALRARVASLAAAIEARDPAALQQHLAEDFIGNGGLDRNGARRLAMGFALRHREIGLTLGPLGVDMAPAHAPDRGQAILGGGSGRALPDSAQVYDVESGWRLQDGEWMLVSAGWKRAL